MNYKKIATGISWVLHPFLLPVYLMAVLLTMTAFSHYPPNVKFYLLWVVALYAIVIPLLSLGVLRSLGRISDYRIDDRSGTLPAAARRGRLLRAVRHHHREDSFGDFPA